MTGSASGRTNLDAAVLDGIQKRIDRLDPERLTAKVRALLGPDDRAADDVVAIEVSLRSIARRIDALISSVGEERPYDLPSFRRAARELERERDRLERELVGGARSSRCRW